MNRLNFRPLFILSLHTQKHKYLLAVFDFLTKYVSGVHVCLISQLYRSGTVQTERIDSLPGNTNIIGKWFFRLENSKGEQDAILKCLRWLKTQPDPASYSDDLEPCPCTLRQGRFDERFQWTPPKAANTFCVYTRFPSSANRGRQCCYYTSSDTFGALITGYPDGGVIDRYHRFATRSLRLKHEYSDVEGFKDCCLLSRLCKRFYAKRPSESCEKYRPPVWSKLVNFNYHDMQ